ncbi:MAG: NUDIX hydrolase [Candidatus Yanofskybacteria bacterium]|nr:NUDIX hydrolase [Candidatus Yanofskybacteria bacterium]
MRNKDAVKNNWPSDVWVAVDAVIFTVDNEELKILLINRPIKPFRSRWSLPGGFIGKNEEAFDAASRLLKQKADIGNIFIEQLFTFDDLNRDPRGRVISITYFALLSGNKIRTFGGDGSQLFSIRKLPKLAFDHDKIIQYATRRLRSKLEYTNAAYSLLPRYFTLGQLQKVYEVVFGRRLDKRNFRKKFLLLGLIKPTGKIGLALAHRPARLYQFISRKPAELAKFL